MPYDATQHFGCPIDDGTHGPYKNHFACFTCRKVWKPHPPPRASQWAAHCMRVETCPDCGGETTNMGPCFKAPPQSDKRAWLAIELYINESRRRIPWQAREILEKTGGL